MSEIERTEIVKVQRSRKSYGTRIILANGMSLGKIRTIAWEHRAGDVKILKLEIIAEDVQLEELNDLERSAMPKEGDWKPSAPPGLVMPEPVRVPPVKG